MSLQEAAISSDPETGGGTLSRTIPSPRPRLVPPRRRNVPSSLRKPRLSPGPGRSADLPRDPPRRRLGLVCFACAAPSRSARNRCTREEESTREHLEKVPHYAMPDNEGRTLAQPMAERRQRE